MKWVAEELETINLGDKRRNRRAIRLMEQLAQQTTGSIPTACAEWSQTQAVYRFLGNEAFDWQDLLAPHWRCTEQRMAQQPVVLCLQDTTELNFNGQQIKGLGPLSYEHQRGMYLHTTYIVTPERAPLGVFDAWMWARQPKDKVTGQRPADILESQGSRTKQSRFPCDLTTTLPPVQRGATPRSDNHHRCVPVAVFAGYRP